MAVRTAPLCFADAQKQTYGDRGYDTKKTPELAIPATGNVRTRAQLIDEPWQTVSCDMMLPSADPFVTRVCVASSRKKLALRGTDLLCSPSRPFVIADRLALSSAHRSFGSVEPKQE
jgi:hypothetical protein